MKIVAGNIGNLTDAIDDFNVEHGVNLTYGQLLDSDPACLLFASISTSLNASVGAEELVRCMEEAYLDELFPDCQDNFNSFLTSNGISGTLSAFDLALIVGNDAPCGNQAIFDAFALESIRERVETLYRELYLDPLNYRRTPAEQLLVDESPLEAFVVYMSKRDAFKLNRIYFEVYQDDFCANAFLHASWAALVANSIGSTKALAWTSAHEDHGGLTEDIEMDLLNNEVGSRVVGEFPHHTNPGHIGYRLYHQELLTGELFMQDLDENAQIILINTQDCP